MAKKTKYREALDKIQGLDTDLRRSVFTAEELRSQLETERKNSAAWERRFRGMASAIQALGNAGVVVDMRNVMHISSSPDERSTMQNGERR
jgi:hypothetical protein